MFYSTSEIAAMSKGHRDDLQRSCRNCRVAKAEKARSKGVKASVSLVSLLVSFIRA